MTDTNEFPFVILSAPEGSLDFINVFVTRDPSDALRMTDNDEILFVRKLREDTG